MTIKKVLIIGYGSIGRRHYKIYVGYNLRFHPLLKYLKKYLSQSNDKLLSVNIYAGSYLPDWRKNTNYVKSYSASKRKGGGVELDLSHEIDYASWLFGKFNILEIINSKIIGNQMDKLIGILSLFPNTLKKNCI